MARFIVGEDRNQSTLFPDTLEDYISEENPVRIIDIFVDEMDLYELGFERAVPKSKGRPGYDPSVLLKLYIYGYLNQIQSSRKLEKEANRNVELMWLTQRLAPDFKTIADFRKDNGGAITKVCSEFVLICRRIKLFTDNTVVVDGSKFKAVNTRDRNFTQAKLKRRLDQINVGIKRYLGQLESADRVEQGHPSPNTKRLKDKIEILKEEITRLNALEAEMQKEPDNQISLTDPDARSMATSGRGSGMVGYNVQAAVDVKNHLVIYHEVTKQGYDRHQLFNMASKAKSVLRKKYLTVIADRGYYKSEEILECYKEGINVVLPKQYTSNSIKRGQFSKRDFRYVEKDDGYICPANEFLEWYRQQEDDGKLFDWYSTSACATCPLKKNCTDTPKRIIRRWEHEGVLEEVQMNLNQDPEKMSIRRQTVEHPFGTIKSWMGYTHFQMKTLKNVSTEMSLHVLAYNFKRVLSILGFKNTMKAVLG